MIVRWLAIASSFACAASRPPADPTSAALPTQGSDRTGDGIVRQDFAVRAEDGLRIFVRRVTHPAHATDRAPMLLVNGGRPGVLASWDVDRPGPSTAELLARAGHTVYLMDARGFGHSAFPATMADGQARGPTAVRSYEVVRDIAATVDEIRRRHPERSQLVALGWATGSQWLGHYASLYPERISHLIYYQGAYGGPAGGWPFQSVAAPADPSALDRGRFDAYRCSTADAVVRRLAEETTNRTFLDRYAELALEGDARATDRDPPCFRFPSGPLADTLLMVNGRPLFDAAFIRSHVLILRSENDFWSRPSDAQTLKAHLRNAASARIQTLSDASHYVHLLPDSRRRPFIDAVLRFTKDTALAPEAEAESSRLESAVRARP